MVTVTEIVRGKYFDGCSSEDDDERYIAKKINDIYKNVKIASGRVLSVTTFRTGGLLVATIVYAEAAPP